MDLPFHSNGQVNQAQHKDISVFLVPNEECWKWHSNLTELYLPPSAAWSTQKQDERDDFEHFQTHALIPGKITVLLLVLYANLAETALSPRFGCRAEANADMQGITLSVTCLGSIVHRVFVGTGCKRQ